MADSPRLVSFVGYRTQSTGIPFNCSRPPGYKRHLDSSANTNKAFCVTNPVCAQLAYRVPPIQQFRDTQVTVLSRPGVGPQTSGGIRSIN